MRKMFFLVLTLLLVSAASINAQVNIGSPDEPNKGAVLDLSQSGSERGVLLPRVYLFNAKQYQLPVDEGTDVSGMLVYNTNSSLADGVGLYAWNGSKWRSMIGDSRCVPVTATSSFSKTGSNAKITITVTEGTPNFSYIWYKEGVTNPVQTTANVSAASDNYTTTGAGTYSCKIANPCTVTPVSFTFTVDANGETLIDNGNGTFTDGDGNLIYKGKIYKPVKSDIPGVYLDETGEIVYAGADGIPGTADDDVFVVPTTPMPRQKTLFSISSPIHIYVNEVYPIVLDFADGSAQGAHKIKYLSSDPSVIAVNANGEMTVVGLSTQIAIIAVIVDDGSIVYSSKTVYSETMSNSSNKLDEVLGRDVTLAAGSVRKLSVAYQAAGGSTNVLNVASLTYSIDNANGTGASVTPGGWFQAGTPGIVTVTATAEAFEVGGSGSTYTKIGTITVTVIGDPAPEAKPYETTSTNWATLDPAPAYAGGDGTEANPYQISSIRQFKKLAVDVSLVGATDATYQTYFELTADLDFSGDNTVTQSLIDEFYGNLDGKGHVIKDLKIDATGKSNIGLFKTVGYGEIKNLGRDGGSTIGNGIYIAGLISSVSNGAKIINCYNSSSITADNHNGGLVYSMNSGSGNTVIENCYNSGDIVATGDLNGGLIGTCLNNGGTVTIANSYNTGNVTGANYNGGIIGTTNTAHDNQQNLNMTNCFNFGNIIITANNARVGSILGRTTETEASLIKVNAINVYSRPEVASANNGAAPKPNQPIGWANGAGQTLANAILSENPTMKEDATYTLDYSKSTSFVIELGGAFKYANGRTPKLAWEK